MKSLLHKKVNALLVAVIALAGLTFGLLAPATADKPDRGPKPPKAAIDQIRGKLERPDALDPDSTSGRVRPDAGGLALILRDPETGNVLREPDGTPKLARNTDGSIATFLPDQIPPDQLAAQGKYQEKIGKAEKGDAKAKAELADEERKSADAFAKKPK